MALTLYEAVTTVLRESRSQDHSAMVSSVAADQLLRILDLMELQGDERVRFIDATHPRRSPGPNPLHVGTKLAADIDREFH